MAGTGPILQGSVAVVAGGSSGIGRAVVERFVEHGSTVEFAANDPDGVADLERKLRAEGADARGSVVNASNPEAVAAFMDGVAQRHGRRQRPGQLRRHPALRDGRDHRPRDLG